MPQRIETVTSESIDLLFENNINRHLLSNSQESPSPPINTVVTASYVTAKKGLVEVGPPKVPY